jgi:type VI secretion system lysozyme-like protein
MKIIHQTHYKPASILCHFQGANRTEAEISKQQSLQKVLEDVQTELGKLLNYKRNHLITEMHGEHIDDSILAYGLPDLSHYNPNSERDRLEVKHLLQTTIENYETRLQNISIVDEPLTEAAINTSMRFTVHATLVLAEERLSLRFDSVIQPDSDEVRLHHFAENVI